MAITMELRNLESYGGADSVAGRSDSFRNSHHVSSARTAARMR